MPTSKQPPRREEAGPRSPGDPGKRTGADQGLPVVDRDKHYDSSGNKLLDLEHVGAMAPDADPSED